VTALSQAARERIEARINEQIDRQPPPSKESVEEVATLIAAIRIRWAREAAARKTARPLDLDGDGDAG
jgi:hypothetical protein